MSTPPLGRGGGGGGGAEGPPEVPREDPSKEPPVWKMLHDVYIVDFVFEHKTLSTKTKTNPNKPSCQQGHPSGRMVGAVASNYCNYLRYVVRKNSQLKLFTEDHSK